MAFQKRNSKCFVFERANKTQKLIKYFNPETMLIVYYPYILAPTLAPLPLLIFHWCPYFCLYIVVINKTDEDNIAGVNTGLWSAIYLVMFYSTLYSIL